MPGKRRSSLSTNKKIILLAVLVGCLLVITPFLGIVPVKLRDVFSASPAQFVFWQLRVPRALLGFMAGAILALAGLVCQNLFKNDLATPDLLGISSGAAAGAVIALKFNIAFSFLGARGAAVFSFLGALSAILFIYIVARLIKNATLYTFLMSGLAINFFYSSVIVFFQYIFDLSDTFSLLRWLMGGIAVSGYGEVLFLLPLLVLFLVLILVFNKEFLMVAAGEDFARSRGLNVAAFRLYSFLGLAVFVGSVVSICGPIGFVALVVPHVSRSWGGGRFPATVAFTLLLGGGLLLAADLLARSLAPPVDIPVGIVASLLGAPFFLLLLVAQLKKID
jgi:iron complex transport system permease protein